MEPDRYRIDKGRKVKLSGWPSDETGGFDTKQDARAELKHVRRQIDRILRVMAAQAKHSVLVILQGVDASGKDGAVRHVFTGVNPQICRVTSFKEPSTQERAHDFLWRIYPHIPEAGSLAVFNRSHYEDVLVPCARGLLPRRETQQRLREIREVERIWAANGITILKFLLHIGHAEQTSRFESRLRNEKKHWKVNESDFSDRRLWTKFLHAYEDAIHATSRDCAPWYVVPSDKKWYRDVVIARVLLERLQQLPIEYPKPKLDVRSLREQLNN